MIKTSKIPPELAGNKLSGYVSISFLIKCGEWVVGLCRDGHKYTSCSYTLVRKRTPRKHAHTHTAGMHHSRDMQSHTCTCIRTYVHGHSTHGRELCITLYTHKYTHSLMPVYTHRNTCTYHTHTHTQTHVQVAVEHVPRLRIRKYKHLHPPLCRLLWHVLDKPQPSLESNHRFVH